VLALDPEYRWAVAGETSVNSWVLARDKQLSEQDRQNWAAITSAGYQTSQFRKPTALTTLRTQQTRDKHSLTMR
jgi:lipocalin